MGKGGYSIDKVIVNKNTGELLVFVKAGEDEDIDCERIKREIYGRFGKKRDFYIRVIPQCASSDLGKVMEKRWNYFCEVWSQSFPSCALWIKNCSYSIEGKRVLILLDDEIALHTLNGKGFAPLARRMIGAVANADVEVKLSWREKEGAFEHQEDYQDKRDREELREIQRIISSNKKRHSKRISQAKGVLMGKAVNENPQPITEVVQESGTVVVEGVIFRYDARNINSQRYSSLISLLVTDYCDSIEVRIFTDKNGQAKLEKNLGVGDRVRIRGEAQYNRYAKEIIIVAKDIVKIAVSGREDTSSAKRVELHTHTRFSAMDGVTPVEGLIRRAAVWGHPAIAITDHGVVQAFPEAYGVSKEIGIKVIYGVEGYLVDDLKAVYWGDSRYGVQDMMVVLDIETTGLDPAKDEITEIGAVKICDGKMVERFHSLVDPRVPIPAKIVELTGITDEMVRGCPGIEEVLPKFLDFAEGCVLAAHNAPFDLGFIKAKASRLGQTVKNPVLDTLGLSRVLYPQLRSHKLNAVAKHLGISLKERHRAQGDADATAKILIKGMDNLKKMQVSKLADINRLWRENTNTANLKPFHVVILAKNQRGLENLYRLISKSHLDYFYKFPRIPKTQLAKLRDGLLVGGACESGEVFRAVAEGKGEEELNEIASFYDYLEIQPLGNNDFMLENGSVNSVEDLQRYNMTICNLGKRLGIPVAATGDVHFLDSEDEVFRRVIMAGMGYDDAENQAPLFLKTTGEMLEEFYYLGEQLAREVVVENPNRINDWIEEVVPIPLGTSAPKLQGSDEELTRITLTRAKEIYGDPLPDIVRKRLDKELKAIIDNGYAVMYIIAQRLVSKSLEDGYLVGSRGSVGSSLVATMSGITEVNPLPPHYLCSNCKYSEFILDGSAGAGADLVSKNCPECSGTLDKLGFDIPFEVFMGFEGDKEPDIDLNFSGEYQNKAHRFTEELFGKDHVYRAGTIATLADKTAYGFVKKYIEERDLPVHNAEINRLVQGCTGIKRTTGQHPGGVMIVPMDREIYHFTPVQKPADDASADVITTHFDYHALSGKLLKLDILGHDDPTMLRMLHKLTAKDPRSIPLDDEKTMDLFRSTSSLGITQQDIECSVGSLGIPEFGTKFVRQMLEDTRPTTFAELVRISGLSHGTDVWLNNAQDLILNGTATLKEVISTRDDIMTSLVQRGMEPKLAFRIMERVRKGKGLSEEDVKAMNAKAVPQWFIDSCHKIKYMFPKAHAVAYVTMAFRIAYYKAHYPLAFYAAYFTVRADEFDAQLIVGGKEEVSKAIKALEGEKNGLSQREKSLLTILEIAREMYCRGYGLLPVDIYKSDKSEFLMVGNALLPPLNSLQGLGVNAAANIEEARGLGPFLSIEDLQERAKLSRTVIEILKAHGCLDGLPLSNQISLF